MFTARTNLATANPAQQTETSPSQEQLYSAETYSDISQTQTSDHGHLAPHHALPRTQTVHSPVASPTAQGIKSPSGQVYLPSDNSGIDIYKQLPPVVDSARAGWQQTSQGSAVVSGLLATVAAQLLQYFRDDKTYFRRPTSEGAQRAVLALCYATIFLNIGATISTFIIIDNMGSLNFVAARSANDRPTISYFDGSEAKLLKRFGAGWSWKYIVAGYVISFYGGVLCLVTLLLTFVWLQEALVIGIFMTVLVTLSIIMPPVLYHYGYEDMSIARRNH